MLFAVDGVITEEDGIEFIFEIMQRMWDIEGKEFPQSIQVENIRSISCCDEILVAVI